MIEIRNIRNNNIMLFTGIRIGTPLVTEHFVYRLSMCVC